MTAVASMKLSTTQLADLPGNKVSHFGGTKQTFQVHKQVQLNARRVVPSEHFIKASDQESNSEEKSSDEEDDELTTSRSSTYQFNISQESDAFKPFKMTATNKVAPPRPLMQQPKLRTITSEKKLTLSDNIEEINNENNLGNLSNTSFHVHNEARQRRLLDELIEYDEEEEWKINGIKTDEEIYIMWKCGETKKRNRTPTETNTNKSNRGNRTTTGKPSSNQLLKKDSKLDLLCAWETVYNKKPVQKLKEERKQRLSLPNYVYNGNKNSNNDKIDPTNSFTFFHYTDIARYIQQYRSNNICENPCANHPGCCHDHSQYQEVRDFNFPFKFDLTTNSIRNKLSSRGLVQNGRTQDPEYQQNRVMVAEEDALLKGHDSVSGYLTPVGFRPPHSAKSPTVENWKSFPESPSRLRHQLKKIWRSYEQNRTSSPQNEDKKLPATSEGPRHNTAHHTLTGLLQGADAAVKTEVRGKRTNDVNFDQQRCDSKLPDEFTNASKRSQQDSNPLAKFREFSMDENCLQVKDDRESLSRVSVEHFPDKNAFLNFAASREARHHESEKKRRMRNLIATEINNLQRKQIITIEQKRKLDKYKDALKIVPGERRVDSKGTMTTPDDKISKQYIAGSVRAYYTRTTTSGSFIDAIRTQTIKCGPDFDVPDKNDDKPIIYVTQPHLRHLTKKPHHSDAALKGKKLIGGRTVDKPPHHPADAKQFTSITDLLRIKERKQSGRHVISGVRSSPVESNPHKKTLRDSKRSLKTSDFRSNQNE